MYPATGMPGWWERSLYRRSLLRCSSVLFSEVISPIRPVTVSQQPPRRSSRRLFINQIGQSRWAFEGSGGHRASGDRDVLGEGWGIATGTSTGSKSGCRRVMAFAMRMVSNSRSNRFSVGDGLVICRSEGARRAYEFSTNHQSRRRNTVRSRRHRSCKTLSGTEHNVPVVTLRWTDREHSVAKLGVSVECSVFNQTTLPC